MYILVPWKPVVLVWGLLSGMIFCWFRCVFGASRKGPLRARCDHHAARSRENGYGAIGATT